MSAPWGIELNKDVLRVIQHHILEALSYNCDNSFVLFGGDVLGSVMRLEGSCLKAFDEALQSVNSDFLNRGWESVLSHVVWRVQDKNVWEVSLFNSEVLCKSLLETFLDVRFDEEDLALELAGCICEDLVKSRLRIFLVSHEEDAGISILENGFDGFLREFHEVG